MGHVLLELDDAPNVGEVLSWPEVRDVVQTALARRGSKRPDKVPHLSIVPDDAA